MAKKVRLIADTYSDEAYVEKVYNGDNRVEEALFRHCRQYFDEHYIGVFFTGEGKKKDIFQEAFITLWQIIEDRRIYVEDGILKGRKGETLKSSLATFFMGIARLKNLEFSRKFPWDSSDDVDVLEREVFDAIYGMGEDEEEVQLRIVSECLSQMSPRCNQIITKFYYEEKSLDAIMAELDTFMSKDALKTAKYKCMENLRDSAKAMYERYLSA